jgi:hypothetical protein
LVLALCAHRAHAQDARFSDRGRANSDWAAPFNQSLLHPLVERDSGISHRRATIIGATAGAIIGGVGTAGYILNALAPDCVTAVSALSTGPTVRSTHCTHRSQIVVVETVTIATGATVGGFVGAWVARRVAGWHDHRHRD